MGARQTLAAFLLMAAAGIADAGVSTVTLSIEIDGGGSVVLSPGNIAIPGGAGVTCTPFGGLGGNPMTACTVAVLQGIAVTLTPTPGGGEIFVGWFNGICSRTRNCSFTADTNKNAVAHLNPPTVDVRGST